MTNLAKGAKLTQAKETQSMTPLELIEIPHYMTDTLLDILCLPVTYCALHDNI